MKTMRKSALLMAVMAAVLAAPTVAFSTNNTISGVVGGQTAISCTQGTGTITLKISNFQLVRTQADGAFPTTLGAKLTHNVTLNKDDYVADASNAFAGTGYIFGLGTDWKNQGKLIDKLDLAKAIAKGTIAGGTFTVTVPVKSDIMWYRMIGVADVGGARGWVGADTSSGYLAHNVNGYPLWVVGQDCQKPTPEIITAVGQME